MLSSIGGRSDDVCALMKGRRDDRRLDLSNKMNAEAEIDCDTNFETPRPIISESRCNLSMHRLMLRPRESREFDLCRMFDYYAK
jgi:hypothetical protein